MLTYLRHSLRHNLNLQQCDGVRLDGFGLHALIELARRRNIARVEEQHAVGRVSQRAKVSGAVKIY